MHGKTRGMLLLLGAAVWIGGAEAAAQEEGADRGRVGGPMEGRLEERIEERIEALREAWGIPGLAVTVVAGDSVLMARGFGVRRAGRPEPVDDETLFAIGSTTKAFTSALVATLVEEGRLGWDDRVVDRLRWFRLRDPWVTREITLRDLLAHRSGLPMANFMWLPGGATSEELVRRLEHLEPVDGFRTTFTYQNVLYAAVGEVVEEVTGRSWAQAVSERLLGPLGMHRTRTGTEGLDAVDNVARPHVLREDGAVPVPYRDVDAVGAAGSVLSSADDMAAWLLFQLRSGGGAGGVPDAPAALAETHIPQTPMRPEGLLSAFYPEAASVAYGMGWTVSDYRGRPLLDHGGGIDGMTALVALLPREGIGVSILANGQLPAPPYWILYTVLDALLGDEPTDWSARFREMTAGFGPPPAPGRVQDAPPARQLRAYAGWYESPVLGRLRVRAAGDGLRFDLGTMEGTLEPWHYETFRGDWRDVAWTAAAGPAWLTFRSGKDGEVASLVLEPLPGETWEFVREAQPSSSSAQSRR